MTSQTLINIEVQLPIEGIPYAFAKYHLQWDESKTVAQIHAWITAEIKAAPKELSTQNVLEVKQMQELLDDTIEKSEMKSRLIESLKQALGEEKYNEIRESTLNSAEFKAITKHSHNVSTDA